MTIHFYLSPLTFSLITNVILLGLCYYIFKRKQQETTYDKLQNWYIRIFIAVSLATPLSASIASLKEWNELGSIQWVNIGLITIASAGNTILAAITNIAKRVQHGDGIIPTNGNTKILKKEDVPETQTTVEQQIAK